MNISVEIVISTLSAISAIALSFAIVKVKIGLFEKEIEVLQAWKDKHIEDNNERLREIEKEQAELRGMMAVGTEQYKEILRRLTIIELKMEERRTFYKQENGG